MKKSNPSLPPTPPTWELFERKLKKLQIEQAKQAAQLREKDALIDKLQKRQASLVKKLQAKQASLIKKLQAENEKQRDLIKTLTQELKKSEAHVRKLLRLLYGTKSEKYPSGKEPATEQETPPNQSGGKKGKESKKGSRKGTKGRKPLPPKLPRENIKHDLEAKQKTCDCGGSLRVIGEITTEQLDFKPAQFYVKVHHRQKCVCQSCHQIYSAKLPPQPIDKGLPGAGLLAEIMINKYQDHLPLYRQQQRFARHGIELSRSTLCDWIKQICLLLRALVDRMKKQGLLTSDRLFVDDTTIPVLDKTKPGKTHTGRLWAYLGGGTLKPNCVVYEYTQTRSQSELQWLKENFSGYLQADAYPGYDALYQTGKIIEVGCWAHARRRFIDIIKAAKLPSHADTAVKFISALYALEEQIKNFSRSARRIYRRKYAKHILKKFKRWLNRKKHITLPQSPLGQAISYTLNHWRALNNYLRDGILNIDNNPVERAIKPLVLGRKNYLFAGSHEGAQRAAIIYSLIETCKLNSVNPYDYLKDILTRLPTTLITDLDTLLPYNWSPQTPSVS